MATVREVVLPHHKKEDGTWNVKIRVTHKRKCTYIDTEHFVNSKQLRKDHKIKDHFILDLLYPVLKEYRDKISGLGGYSGVIDQFGPEKRSGFSVTL
jgi:hypothetical protein